MDVTAQIDEKNSQQSHHSEDEAGATKHATAEEAERLAVMIRDLEREFRTMSKTVTG